MLARSHEYLPSGLIPSEWLCRSGHRWTLCVLPLFLTVPKNLAAIPWAVTVDARQMKKSSLSHSVRRPGKVNRPTVPLKESHKENEGTEA